MAFQAAVAKTPWRYYELVFTQWPTSGAQKNFVDFASSSYAATTSGALPASITAPTLAPAQGCAPYIFLSK